MEQSRPIELNKKNNQEHEAVNAEIVHPDTLRMLIIGDEYELKDKRFLPIDKGGVFKYFDVFEDLSGYYNRKNEKEFAIVQEGDTITGIAGLRKNPFEDNAWWLTFISVDPKYQGKGYATKLAEEAFKFAAKKGVTLEGSGYSTLGDLKLRSVVRRLAEKYHVPFIDKPGVSFPDR